MGTILSSNKDYNRALAKQPRSSIDISNFELPNNVQQPPLIGTLSIPEPVRSSQLHTPIPVFSNEPSHSELNKTSIQHNSHPILDNRIQQEQPSSEEQLVGSSSRSLQTNFLPNNQTMNSNATVISRSVINLNNHGQMNNNQFSSFRPNRSIVERNGRQYLTELQERLERRYVQVFDKTIGRMRLFEVTDYIPSRTVRSMRTNPQFQPQNGISRNHLPPRFASNHHSALPPIPNNRLEPAASSNLVNFKTLNNREAAAREFDLYHSGATIPFNNNNNNNNNISHPQLTTRHSTDSAYSHPQPITSHTSTSQQAPNQYTSGSYNYQAPSYRQHSPTVSDDSGHRSTSNSRSSGDSLDSEGIDRTLPSNTKRNGNSTDISYGTIRGHNSPAPLDPFKKTISTHDPYYKKRPNANNYAEPIINNRGFQSSTAADYAPIPVTHKQSNLFQSHFSHRRDSNTYDG